MRAGITNEYYATGIHRKDMDVLQSGARLMKKLSHSTLRIEEKLRTLGLWRVELN